MRVYGCWNNKGGTGKTSVNFQAICEYGRRHAAHRVLVADVCPQANLSELLLGGLTNQGSDQLLALQGEPVRRTIGGYFQTRLPQPYQAPAIDPFQFITTPSKVNIQIPGNIELLAGDPLLELQANAMSTLANNQIPGTNTWIGVIDWLRDFIKATGTYYSAIFIDANPSFSIYTQTALAAVDRLILPVMADDSSRRAVQNAFSLVYGLKLPSEIYTQHAFATRMLAANRALPKVHLIVKNRLTQYMGPASAYSAVLKSIDTDVARLMATNADLFTFTDPADGFVDVRDFQTTGVVAFAKGSPFYLLKDGRVTVVNRRVRVSRQNIDNCQSAVNAIVDKL
jgi:cellulose biosynthesis protein BcsQ